MCMYGCDEGKTARRRNERERGGWPRSKVSQHTVRKGEAPSAFSDDASQGSTFRDALS